MIRPSTFLSVSLLLPLCAAGVFAHSSGAPSGFTGAPGDGNCTACHIGTVNSGSGSVRINLIDAITYGPGQLVHLTVTDADPTAMRWGFELTARLASDGTKPAGTLSLAAGEALAQLDGSPGSVQYVTHTSAGTRAGTSGGATWDVYWTAPSASVGTVTFYAAGNAANNNGQPTGDHIYTTSLSLNAAPPGGSVTHNLAMPQLVYGEGWYTAVYLTNTGSSGATATLDFVDPAGAPLPVTLTGGTVTTSQVVSLPAGGSTLVEMPDQGAATQGSILLNLPTGVSGYGIFRREPVGTPAQEATVPLASLAATKVTVIFDDTTYLTTIAVLNPSDTDATLTITTRDSTGQPIGPGVQQSLAARNRIAFVLHTLVSGVSGQRGAVDFSVDKGSVSVLALRANGNAFTSIIPITVQ
jgi:hypothetical protein